MYLCFYDTFYVNYPSSKANGLPALLTSQPTISTGVNSGSPCPIYFFILFALILLLIYFLLRLYPCHVLPHIADISTSSLTNLLYLHSDSHRLSITGCWHRTYLFWHISFRSIPLYTLTASSARTTIRLIWILPDDDFLPCFF